MLAPASILKYLVRRFLNPPSPEGPESEGYARGLRYNELAVGSIVRKSHLLVDEGSYFVVNNAQTGIIETTNTGFVVTAPTLYLTNTADPADPTAKSIGVDYVDLSVQTAGVTGTAVQGKALALYLAKGNNYSSGGTDLSSKIVNVNPIRAVNSSIAKCYFGALTTTDLAVSKGNTRPIVGQRVYRMPVTATTAPDVVGDRLRLEFGGVESEASGQFGTTGALEANVFQTVMKMPPVLIPPGWSMALFTWDIVSGGTYGTGVTWLPEAGWWER
jgi:hypothetical protein